jgi:hypothetical protein
MTDPLDDVLRALLAERYTYTPELRAERPRPRRERPRERRTARELLAGMVRTPAHVTQDRRAALEEAMRDLPLDNYRKRRKAA